MAPREKTQIPELVEMERIAGLADRAARAAALEQLTPMRRNTVAHFLTLHYAERLADAGLQGTHAEVLREIPEAVLADAVALGRSYWRTKVLRAQREAAEGGE